MIVKAGETHEALRHERGDFEDWIAAGLNAGDRPLHLQVVDARKTDSLPPAGQIAGVVVSGSHSMVSDREAWSEQTAAWLASLVEAEVPVLGICYGHQLLADALGGKSDYHPAGMELGTVEVTTTVNAAQDPLFADMPSHFDAHVVHRQTAIRLPADAVPLASNDFEPHQAFRVGPNAWGVQFHPEFDEAAMRGYVDHVAQARDDDALTVRVGPTPHAAALLPRFARLVADAEERRLQLKETTA